MFHVVAEFPPKLVQRTLDILVDFNSELHPLPLSANITETPATFGISVGRRR